MTSEYDELSKKVEQKSADALRKTAAATSGAVKGVVSTFPKWLKIVLVVIAVFMMLSMCT